MLYHLYPLDGALYNVKYMWTICYDLKKYPNHPHKSQISTMSYSVLFCSTHRVNFVLVNISLLV